jgi:hypothetical protein
MPAQQIINVIDRPTYQTQKVKGWDIVRIFKASQLESMPEDSGIFNVAENNNIIDEFISSNASNYKGTNLINVSKLENFDSFRIKMNGVFNDNGGWFNFKLGVFDTSHSEIQSIISNYNEQLVHHGGAHKWRDWYLDIEMTFFINDNGEYNFVVNGNYSVSKDGRTDRRQSVDLIPFNGLLTFSNSNNEVYIDLQPNGNTFNIKSINIDFVE